VNTEQSDERFEGTHSLRGWTIGHQERKATKDPVEKLALLHLKVGTLESVAEMSPLP